MHRESETSNSGSSYVLGFLERKAVCKTHHLNTWILKAFEGTVQEKEGSVLVKYLFIVGVIYDMI